MEYLSEDPRLVAGALSLVGIAFLVAMKVTQQGKYLIRAGIAFGLALLVVGIEWLWVTDRERVEDTVLGLSKAVAASDGDRAAFFVDPKCVLEVGPESTNQAINHYLGAIVGPIPDWLRQHLDSIHFDYLRLTRMKTEILPLPGAARVECIAHGSGQKSEPFQSFMIPPDGMGWSFSLREVEPKVWKITRISPGRVDLGAFGRRQ